MELFRKSKTLKIGSNEVVIKEIATHLLLSNENESGEIKLTNEILVNHCTGLNVEDLSSEAFELILKEILELNKKFFEPNQESDVKKK